MSEEVIIPNPGEFEQKKQIFKEQGPDKIHVVSDFDRTITYGTTQEGKRTETVISQLRSSPNYLGKDYFDESHRLFEVYHPIEVDPGIPLGEKIVKMHQWWKEHFGLIAKAGLTKDLINQVVKERSLKFRNGASVFLDFLTNKNVPLIFMSAAPGDMLLGYLKQNNLLLENVQVISNLYEFDDSGKAVKIKEPIIHTFNKTEISLANTEVFDNIKERENIILLGDSLGDMGMAEGFPYKNIIKIGFLNENIDEQLDEYKNNFDVVLTGDKGFGFINNLMKEILE